MTLKTENKTQE